MHISEIIYKTLPLTVSFEYNSADLDSQEDLNIDKVTLDGRQIDLLLSDVDYENIIDLLYDERTELNRRNLADYYHNQGDTHYN